MAAESTPDPTNDEVPPEPKSPEEAAAAPPAKKKAKKPKAPPVCLPAAGALPLPAKLAYPAAALSGVLYWLAFAGMDVWPLAFVAFVPLLVAMHRQTAKRSTLLGLVAGLTMNVAGFYWLQNMLKTFSGFPSAVCFLFVLIISTYQGGRIALMGWLYGRASARGWPPSLMFLGAFVASELLYPLLFPWYYAATVHQVPALTQTADLGGPILVGAILVGANLAMAEPLVAWLEKRKRELRVVLVGAGALGASLIYGALRIPSVDARAASAPSAKVGVVQGNMDLFQKREDPAEGLRRHRRMTDQLRAEGAEFVVWSESSVTFAVPEEIGNEMMYDRVGRHLKVPAIFGGVYYRVPPPGTQDRERWFNTALSTDATGKVNGRYDKTYLLMFGEYLPFGDTFPKLYEWSPHSGKFSAGTAVDPLFIEVGGQKHPVSALVCYEDILPAFTNKAVTFAKPELLVNITNDRWFGDTAEPWQHLALAKLRAIEHRRFLVRSTNSGVSAVVDPVGRTVKVSGTFRPETLLATIHWMSSSTVYETVGDWLYYAISLAMAVLAFRRRQSAA